jgi:exopolyphosphatase/guanosine-5'-triphosphate,3'-diphosphate pyrophosphatase
MRLGVLDVGSNTVHLLVVDAHRGARPAPAYSEKAVLRLAEHIDREGKLSAAGESALLERVESALKASQRLGCDDLLAFATSAVREARNGEKVLHRIRTKTGVDLQVLDGDDEARLTFLAVRRWFGWSAGRLLSLDIGGGSLELAAGVDEEPDVALSLPLGAGRLTRERLTGDPPSKAELADLLDHVEETLGKAVPVLAEAGRPDRVVASSKTFRSLARLTGAAPSGDGPYVRRELHQGALHQVLGFISRIPSGDLAELEGVSGTRAHQLLAGGVVAEAAMRLLDVGCVQISPWALREGVILRRLDWLDSQ